MLKIDANRFIVLPTGRFLKIILHDEKNIETIFQIVLSFCQQDDFSNRPAY